MSGDWSLDQRPSALAPTASLVQVIFHSLWYCSGVGCANRSLWRVRQCCRITVCSGSLQLPSPRLKDHVNAAELLPLTSKGSLGAEATELLGADS